MFSWLWQEHYLLCYFYSGLQTILKKIQRCSNRVFLRSFIPIRNFLFQDRSAPQLTSKSFQGVGFDAQFVSENSLYSSLVSLTGVDGFVLSVDPLYKVGFLFKTSYFHIRTSYLSEDVWRQSA